MVANGWNKVSIGQDCILKARIGWQGLTTKEYRDNGNYFLVTGTDFDNGLVNWDSCHYIDKWRYEQDKNIQLQKDDILITKDGTIGKVGYVEDLRLPATLNSGIFVIRPKTKDIIPKYLYYVFTSKIFEEFLKKLAAGSTINHLYQKDFVYFDFDIPNPSEQKAIAKALSDVDGLIASLEALIEKKEHIKTATMQQLLTGKKRLDGFSGEWVERKLGEVANLYQPQTISQNDLFSDGYLVFGANGIIGKYAFYNHKTWQIIITCRGSTSGTVSKTTNYCWITGNAMVVNIDKNKDLNKDFFYYLLKYQNFKTLVSGSGQPQITREPLEEFKIFLPKSKKEQQAIAQILSDMDKEIEALKTKLEKTKAIKRGMMQELLTGRVRLLGENNEKI